MKNKFEQHLLKTNNNAARNEVVIYVLEIIRASSNLLIHNRVPFL